MASLRIHLPEGEAVYRTQLAIQIADINYGGHLSNASVFLLCHEARLRFLHKHQQSELNFLGTSLIMRNSACVYKSEGFWGDELEVKLFAGEFGPLGFDFFYQLISLNDDREIARVKTGMAFFDYQNKKIQKAPANLSNWFADISFAGKS